MYFLIIIFVIVIVTLVLIMRKKETAERTVSRKHVHDIRSALSVIKTQSEVALLNADLPAELQNMLQNTIKEVNRASQILNELLN
jgi:signal transduction histidine kinase